MIHEINNVFKENILQNFFLSKLESSLLNIKEVYMNLNKINFSMNNLYYSLLNYVYKDSYLGNLILISSHLNNKIMIDTEQILLLIDKIFSNLRIISLNLTTHNIKKQEVDKNLSNPQIFSTQIELNINKNKIQRPKFITTKAINLKNIKTLDFSVMPDRKIGKLEISQRLKKILKYKLNVYSHRLSKPIMKSFSGRSAIAKKKIRLRGRFIKNSKKIFMVNN